jgi:crossover junction endodeoxyribonuclease RusA
LFDYEFEFVGLPPSVNGLYRVFRGRTIVSKKCREYKRYIKGEIKRLELQNEQSTERLFVSIKLYAPNLRKYDVDNRVKVLMDALQASGLIVDDEQLDTLLVDRWGLGIAKGGKTIVKIRFLR